MQLMGIVVCFIWLIVRLLTTLVILLMMGACNIVENWNPFWDPRTPMIPKSPGFRDLQDFHGPQDLGTQSNEISEP